MSDDLDFFGFSVDDLTFKEVLLSFNNIEPVIDELAFNITYRLPRAKSISCFSNHPLLVEDFTSFYHTKKSDEEDQLIFDHIRQISHPAVMELFDKSEIKHWFSENGIDDFRLFLALKMVKPSWSPFKTLFHCVFIRFSNPNDAMLYKLSIDGTDFGLIVDS